MDRHANLSNEIKKKVIRKFEMGKTPSEISEELEIRLIVVINILNEKGLKIA